MAYTRDQIKEIVKHKLDEVSQFDTYQIDSVAFIEEFLDAAAEKILLNVPLHLIPPYHIDPSIYANVVQTTYQDGTGIIYLPSDFLRLSSLKMVAWDRAVSKPITEEHPLYNLQKNSVTRGKPSKPVVVLGYFLDESASNPPDYSNMDSSQEIQE